jgi:CRISPR-associated exonuclease Cas4
MFTEDQIIPISALQHWLYCPRQCALIHLEQAWAENKFTAEGRVMHENAHEGADETKAGVRITRGMPVASERLGLTGQCDVVEFHPVTAVCDRRSSDPCVVPVEYKRGKPKAHRADEVQLCAQAMCLEEMLGIVIPAGALYYGEKRRRTEVVFDEALRELVRKTTEEVRACFTSGRTPLAEYEPRRCDACSLMDFCQPHALRFKKGAAAWFSANLTNLNFKSPITPEKCLLSEEFEPPSSQVRQV